MATVETSGVISAAEVVIEVAESFEVIVTFSVEESSEVVVDAAAVM